MAIDPEPDHERQIDDAAVERYFDGAGGTTAPAAMSMMTHEHNLPSDSIRYRLSQELRTIGPWLDAVSEQGRVLDVGCGAGAWVEIFAKRYGSVIGVERSLAMVEAANERVEYLSNAEVFQGDGRKDLPSGPFDLVFLGGLCMYLEDADVVSLLGLLRSRLSEHGTIILRESTVRKGILLAKGEYQAVYRSVDLYQKLFEEAGIACTAVRQNPGYTSMTIAEEAVDFRRRWLPLLPKDSVFLNQLTWWVLRAGAPVCFWALPRVFSGLNVSWPRLQNHFFRLQLTS